jgi:hypothetical protein
MAGKRRSFATQVDEWTLKTQARYEAVLKTAVMNVVEDIIDRTPVDTGFLRASLTISIDDPVPATREKGSAYVAPPYALAISRLQIGQTIYAGFAANYAGYVEYGTKYMKGAGMVRLAAQAWPRHVRDAVAKAKAAVAANSRRR